MDKPLRLTKKQRAVLREKFGGRCAYCGDLLTDRWHADHIKPVRRTDWMQRVGFRTPPRGPDYPERDVVENMNPACAPCNIDKHTMSLAEWRRVIAHSNEVLERDVSTFRRALRFGLVVMTDAPVKFFFETYKP